MLIFSAFVNYKIVNGLSQFLCVCQVDLNERNVNFILERPRSAMTCFNKVKGAECIEPRQVGQNKRPIGDDMLQYSQGSGAH